MPRPSRNLTRTSVYLDRWLVEGVDVLAAQEEEGNRSEMLRRLVAEALRSRATFNAENAPPTRRSG